MNGFWGNYKSTLDSKGRINFPAKIRKNLREEDQESVILIRGKEKYISCYPLSSWHEKIEKIKSIVENDHEFGVVSRRLMFQASEQKIDKQGRLNISADLIKYAELNGEVMIVGHEKKIELWNPAKYTESVSGTELDYMKITQDLDI